MSSGTSSIQKVKLDELIARLTNAWVTLFSWQRTQTKLMQEKRETRHFTSRIKCPCTAKEEVHDL